MGNNNMTAVEWFAKEINNMNVSREATLFINKLKEQAKQMEQKQHETTFHRGINIGALNPELDCEGRKQSAKHYYNQMYGKE